MTGKIQGNGEIVIKTMANMCYRRSASSTQKASSRGEDHPSHIKETTHPDSFTEWNNTKYGWTKTLDIWRNP